MTKEEVMVAVGVDNRALSAGMQKAEGIVKGFRDNVNKSFTAAFSNFGALFGVAGIVAGVNSLRSWVDGLKDVAEQASVTTGFLQGFRQAGETFGDDAESASRGLVKFAVKLGEAKNGSETAIKTFRDLGVSIGGDTESAIYAAADAIKAIEDPNIRAAKATELFGEKMGTKLMPVLAQGSEGLRKYIEQVNKASEAELEVIDRADKEIKSAGNTMKVWAAKGIGFIASVAEGAGMLTTSENPWESWSGAISDLDKQFDKLNKSPGIKKLLPEKTAAELKEIADLIVKRNAAEAKMVEFKKMELTPAERMKQLQKEDSDLLEKMHNIKEEGVEIEKLRIEEAEKLLEIANLHKDIEKDSTAEKKKQTEEQKKLNEERSKNISEARKNASNSRQSRLESFMPSVSELADFGWNDAKRIQFLESDAKLAFKKGNVDFAKGQIDEADRLRLGLQKTGVLAEDASLKAQRESADTLKRLEEGGIKVKGAD